jgi:hypothetical protein
MKRIIKMLILLFAFLFDLWIWNSRANSLSNKVVFVIVFISAPLLWGLLMDIRSRNNQNIENLKSIFGNIQRMAPHIVGLAILILIILIEIIPLYTSNVSYTYTAEIILFTGVFGFLWNLVISDLEIGE